MFKLLGKMLIDFMRCASGILPIKPFSLQRETRAEVAKSDRRRYLFFSYRLWQCTFPH